MVMIESSISKERLFFLAEQALRITLEETLEPEVQPIPEHVRRDLEYVEVATRGAARGMSLHYSPKLGRAFSEKLNCYSDIQPLEDQVRNSMQLLGNQIARHFEAGMSANTSEEVKDTPFSAIGKPERKLNKRRTREIASMCGGEPFIISLY